MKKYKHQNKFDWLLGLVFLVPVIFSTRLLEMDNLQKLAFFVLTVPLFIVLMKQRIKNEDYFVDPILSAFIFLFPLTFFTAFINKSSDMLILQLTYLLPPLYILFYTVFVLNNIGEETFFRISAFSIAIVSTIFSFIGLLQVMGIVLIPLPQIIIPGSTIGHRGFAAEYLLPAIPYLLILKRYVKKDYHPLLFFAGVINLSFLFFTRSRSALGISIFILIILLVYIIFNKNYQDKIKTLTSLVGVYLISFLLSLIPPIKGERADFSSNVTSVVDAENKSNKLRMNFWKASVQMIIENPFTGIGIQKWSGTYPKYFGGEFVDSQIYFIHSIHSHNDFLELFAENGAAAPFVYLIIILLILYNLYKKSKSNEIYFLILLSGLSTVGFSLIAFPMSKFSSYFFFAFAAGLTLNAVKEKAIRVNPNYLKIALSLLIMVGIFTSYIRLKSELSYIKALEFKNGSDYDNMVKKIKNVNQILYPYDVSKQPIEYYTSMGYYRLRNYDEALVHAVNSEKLSPYNPLVLHNTAGIYQSSKKYNDAVIHYKNLQKLFPNYIDPQINLLIIYSETDQIEEGKNLFNTLIKLDSLNPRLMQLKSKYSNQF